MNKKSFLKSIGIGAIALATLPIGAIIDSGPPYQKMLIDTIENIEFDWSKGRESVKLKLISDVKHALTSNGYSSDDYTVVDEEYFDDTYILPDDKVMCRIYRRNIMGNLCVGNLCVGI